MLWAARFFASKMGTTIRGWKRELERVHERIGGLFVRSEPRARSKWSRQLSPSLVT